MVLMSVSQEVTHTGNNTQEIDDTHKLPLIKTTGEREKFQKDHGYERYSSCPRGLFPL